MDFTRPHVLVVDDDDRFASALVDSLNEAGLAAEPESDPAKVLALVANGTYDVALVDLIMPQISGTDLAGKITIASPDTQVVILTGHADLDSAVESMRQGAFLYLRKDRLDTAELAQTLQHAAARARLTQEKRELLVSLQDSRDLLETLNDFTLALASEADPGRLLFTLGEAAGRITRAEASRALLFGPTHAEGLLVTGAAGEAAEILEGTRLKPGEGITPMVAEQQKTIVLSDPREHPLYTPRCDALTATKPGYMCAPLHHGLAFGALTVAGARRGVFEAEHERALTRLATHAAAALDNALQRERAANFFTHVSNMLVTLLDGLDVSYTGHSRKVAALTDLLTRRMGLTERERRVIHFGGLLHDIGKMRLGLDILGSRTVLTPAQRTAVRGHPALGVEILRPITLWEEILPIVQCHHERWDGKGYPNGLSEDAIPLGARVVAIAEVFDAMRRGVPYPPGRTVDEALQEIAANGGSQFDAKLVHLFVAAVKDHRAEIANL
jgi:putative nucleotidyltransferase with HDIG domain